jgi:hypothetical protein
MFCSLISLQLLARYLSILSIATSCLVMDPLMPSPETYFSHTYFSVHVRVPHSYSQAGGFSLEAYFSHTYFSVHVRVPHSYSQSGGSQS